MLKEHEAIPVLRKGAQDGPVMSAKGKTRRDKLLPICVVPKGQSTNRNTISRFLALSKLTTINY